MDQTNRPEVLKIHNSILFREQGDQSLIEVSKPLISTNPHRILRRHDIHLDYGPTVAIELRSETVWARRFVGWHGSNCLPDLLVSEMGLESR
jgi:hypothetical protein